MTTLYFRQFILEPINNGNGGQTIACFFEDPGFLKKVDISNGQITVQRICPHGHSSPIIFNANEFNLIGKECLPPQNS